MFGNILISMKQAVTIDAWVARDDDGTIRLWYGCTYFGMCSSYKELPSEYFPSVTWESGPQKVKVTIELEEE